MSRRRRSTRPTGTPFPAQRTAPPAPPQVSRWRILGFGLALGLAWGVVMSLIMLAFGQFEADDIGGWIYRIVTPGLIGMVVATVMGPVRQARTEGTLAPRRRLFRRGG